jgi:hypothetical protein
MTNYTMPRKSTSRNPHALKPDDLPKTPKTACRSETPHVNVTPNETQPAKYSASKDLTLELSGGEAVRLERVVRHLAYAYLVNELDKTLPVASSMTQSKH